MSEVNWQDYLPPRPLPDTGPKVFKVGQVWAWAIYYGGGKMNREVDRIVGLTTNGPWKVEVLAKDGVHNNTADIGGRSWAALSAILVQDVGEPTPRDPAVLYGGAAGLRSGPAIGLLQQQRANEQNAAAQQFYAGGFGSLGALQGQAAQGQPVCSRCEWAASDCVCVPPMKCNACGKDMTFIGKGLYECRCDEVPPKAPPPTMGPPALRPAGSKQAEFMREQGLPTGCACAQPKRAGKHGVGKCELEGGAKYTRVGDGPPLDSMPTGCTLITRSGLRCDLRSKLDGSRHDGPCAVLPAGERARPAGVSELELHELALGPWRKR